MIRMTDDEALEVLHQQIAQLNPKIAERITRGPGRPKHKRDSTPRTVRPKRPKVVAIALHNMTAHEAAFALTEFYAHFDRLHELDRKCYDEEARGLEPLPRLRVQYLEEVYAKAWELTDRYPEVDYKDLRRQWREEREPETDPWGRLEQTPFFTEQLRLHLQALLMDRVNQPYPSEEDVDAPGY